jgi:glycosyltransferase involved in cell wall biosynthesis
VKIAMLSHLASRSAPTGAERVLELIARGLAERGHRVAVSAPGVWAFDGSLAEAGVDLRSIPVRCCWLVQADRQPAWRQLLRAGRFFMPDPGTKALESFLLEFQPDVVHVNCLPHLRGAAAARSSGCPVVWHIHEIMPPGARRRWFAARLRRHADRVVAVSEAVAEWIQEEGLEAMLDVVHNGVDVPQRLPDRESAREAFGLPAGATVFGLFSQLVPHKGAIDFVRAAHQMAIDIPDAWFLVAGHGPPSFVATLQRTIADGPAADRMRVVPPQPEIWQLMAAVDVLALTTLWPDPLPRVVMEAMASGRPVVAYGGGGVPEMVVDGETGLLCASGHVDGLSSAMGRLAADEGLRRQMGAAGERRARELFSVERHLDRMETVLEAGASSRARE